MYKYTNWNFLRNNPIALQRIVINSQSTSQYGHDDGDEKQLKEYEIKQLEDKEKLKWRTPLRGRKDVWTSKFSLFIQNKETTSDWLTYIAQPTSFTLSGILKNRKKRKIELDKAMQQFIPERHLTLGNDLATAHFIVFRGGSVKFAHQKNWMKKDKNNEFHLPSVFDPAWKLEAIRCDNMTIYYEGLSNITQLKHLKFLSFYNVKTFDDWCLDRVSGSELDSVEILDLSSTNITENGLTALYRMPSLKMLILDNPQRSKKFELICSMLEEINLNLKIVEKSKIHSE